MSESADSPCIAHCSTALGDNVCRGCFRTFLEVAQWSALVPDDKRQVWECLPLRRRLADWARLLGEGWDLQEVDGQEWAMTWYQGFTKLLFHFEADGSLRLSLPDSALATHLAGGDDAALLSQAKRWLAETERLARG
ncbi:MAG TPA: DUF1289 domain-containing protein [Pseudogulbenkiania sp.]|nr:DUF1289 domain-containing protein [Pseudogulbenkiania sp.]